MVVQSIANSSTRSFVVREAVKSDHAVLHVDNGTPLLEALVPPEIIYQAMDTLQYNTM